MKAAKLVKQVRVRKVHHFKIADVDPADTFGLDIDKAEAKELIAQGLKRLTELQEKLYAEERWSVLIVLQGMDSAGKDGVIKHVMSGINPQGCKVHAFKQPTPEEIDHDFLWRCSRRLPGRGRIGIFNRSYYEDVLVVRVLPELLQHQKLPPQLLTKSIWEERFDSIRAFERHLRRNGTAVLKFFLCISPEEQRRRLLARLDEPAKRWKFSADDLAARSKWSGYMEAYEDMIRNTATHEAPWHVIPADHKWFAWLTVSTVIAETMDSLDLRVPQVTGKALAELKKVERLLSAEA